MLFSLATPTIQTKEKVVHLIVHELENEHFQDG